MNKEKDFGYLGFTFQQSLIKAIIEDRKYGETIIDVLDSRYFENNSFKFIIQNIKELYSKYEKIPDYNTLTQKIMVETNSSNSNRVHTDTLEAIKNDTTDVGYVKDTALNFCKQQNIKRELKLVNTIIDNGEFESYNKIEEIIKKALQVGAVEEDVEDVFNNIEDALKQDFRQTIPTGITGIDNLLKGGLGKAELGVVLAPTGTGKTTLLTKFANTAYNLGFNVLQIFFEDNTGNIKRKHFTIWSGIAPDDQPNMSTEVTQLVNEARSQTHGKLNLIKYSSDSKTVSDLKAMVRKYEAEHGKLDLLVIDYVDCLISEKATNGEEWQGEGSIMRSLESMTSEFELTIWTATQGNRNSIASEVVTGDQMGGSIKKAQIAHVILSIGKTLQQKEEKLGTLTLLKSRIGQDGIVFSNCKFDNEYLVIDTESQQTMLGMEQNKAADKINRVSQALARVNNIKQQNEIL